MTFKFRWLCELLDELDHHRPQRRATFSRHHDPVERIVVAWFKQHVHHISRTGRSAIAFLSALFPERRPDRTYGLQQKRLAQIFGRALGISAGRHNTLKTWQSNQGQDFATCVEYVMGQAENPKPSAIHEVTLEEIDLALDEIASNMPGSASSMRGSHSGREAFEVLAPIIRRLQSYEAKWLVRMIMKSYVPAEIPEYVTQHAFHFLLPKLLLVQNSFDAAMVTLSTSSIRAMPHGPSMEHELQLLPYAMAGIRPRLHTMIMRQPYDKARSIKNCCEMADRRTMSIERKYDGEYCQIHIDLSKGKDCIRIFSKSGRDSTLDRTILHDAIRAGLRLGDDDCRIKSLCIVEGELVIWSRRQKQMLPFYHVRKHVLHGGRRIGNQVDSPKRVDENVMIIFYDVLLLDDEILFRKPHKQRRAHLKAIVKQVEGSSHLVERTQIDFSKRKAAQTLRKAFAEAIVRRWEGFVLKGVDDGYFAWNQSRRGIKLKKDYIGGLGDSADMCVVAGRRDAQAALTLQLGQLRWTHFYVACLLNKTDVRRYGAKPHFRIVDTLGPKSIPKEDILTLNEQGQLCCTPFELDLPQLLLEHRRIELVQPHHAFIKPMVVEIIGAGFERAQNTDYWILRFPRKVGPHTKLHQDRDAAETVSFDELQQMAERCMREGPDKNSQEDALWIQKLLHADPRSKYKDQVTQSTCTTPGRTPNTVTTASISPLNGRLRVPKGTAVRVGSDSPQVCLNAQVSSDKSVVEEDSNELADMTRKRGRLTTCTDEPKAGNKRAKQSSLPLTSPSRKRLVFAENANSMILKPLANMSGRQQAECNTSKRAHGLEQRATLPQTSKRVMNNSVEGDILDAETTKQHEGTVLSAGELVMDTCFDEAMFHAGNTQQHEAAASMTGDPNEPIFPTMSDVCFDPTLLLEHSDPNPQTTANPQTNDFDALLDQQTANFDNFLDAQTTNVNTDSVEITQRHPLDQPLQNIPPPNITPHLPTSLQSSIPETQPTPPPTRTYTILRPLHLYVTPSALSQETQQSLQAHLTSHSPATFTTSPYTFIHVLQNSAFSEILIALIPSSTPQAAQNAAHDLQHLITQLQRHTIRLNINPPTRVLITYHIPVFEVALLDGRNLERLLDVLERRDGDVQGLKPWFCAVLEVKRLACGAVSAKATYGDADLRRALGLVQQQQQTHGYGQDMQI